MAKCIHKWETILDGTDHALYYTAQCVKCGEIAEFTAAEDAEDRIASDESALDDPELDAKIEDAMREMGLEEALDFDPDIGDH